MELENTIDDYRRKGGGLIIFVEQILSVKLTW